MGKICLSLKSLFTGKIGSRESFSYYYLTTLYKGRSMSSMISGLGSTYASQIMSGASGRQTQTQGLEQLFNQMDGNKSGSITREEFSTSFAQKNPSAGLKAMGPNEIFNQLDPNRTGTVSKEHFVSGMKKILASLRVNPVSNMGQEGGNSSLSASLDSLNSIMGKNSGNLPPLPNSTFRFYA
ncbi:MAG: EF-hand domain-containing protein [Nitrospinae bacterium]|nr:EF-hand domain-containing protein [Nitrospinota bacterium]